MRKKKDEGAVGAKARATAKKLGRTRIEVAAHKREVDRLNSVIQAQRSTFDAEQDRQRREHPGNAAAMRKALIRCATLGEYCFQDIHAEVANVSRAALAKPPRQCDVGTAEEQAERLREFCKKHRDGVRRCSRCPVERIFPKDCTLAWAQMPYEESERTGKA